MTWVSQAWLQAHLSFPANNACCATWRNFILKSTTYCRDTRAHRIAGLGDVTRSTAPAYGAILLYMKWAMYKAILTLVAPACHHWKHCVFTALQLFPSSLAICSAIWITIDLPTKHTLWRRSVHPLERMESPVWCCLLNSACYVCGCLWSALPVKITLLMNFQYRDRL